MYRGGGINAEATTATTIINSTISGNSASNGGGVYGLSSTYAITNSTIASNAAYGIYRNGTNSVVISKTILSGNTISNCGGSAYTNGGNNLSSDASCSFGSGSDNIDPLLGVLKYNGGLTQTHLPSDSSPALDVYTCTSEVDQRGFPRPQADDCDTGAVEVLTNGRIAYSEKDGDWDVWTIDPDGSNATNLTNSYNGLDDIPAWSPDGSKLVFRSYRDDSNGELYVMDADGSNVQRLTNSPTSAEAPGDWSPDGSKIVFVSNMDGNNEIYVMDSDPATNDTWVRLTNNPASDTEVAWSPDGKQIIFRSDRDHGSGELYLMNAFRGTGTLRLTTNTNVYAVPAWSPDSSQIMFMTDRSGYDLWTMNADGTNQTQFTTVTSVEGYSSYSPDGKQTSFSSNTDGNMEVHTSLLTGGSWTKLTDNTLLSYNRDWAPGGESGGGESLMGGPGGGFGGESLTSDSGSDSLSEGSAIIEESPRIFNPLPIGYHEETHPDVLYSGRWQSADDTSASGGTLGYTNDPQGTVEFAFEGTGVMLYTSARPDASPTRQICLDGVCETYNGYNPVNTWSQIPFTGLTMGVHTIRMVNNSDGYGDLDAIRVLGTDAPDAEATVEVLPTETPTLTPTLTETPTLTATPAPIGLPFVETFNAGTGWTPSGSWLFDNQNAFSVAGWYLNGMQRDLTSTLEYNGSLDLRGASHPQLGFWQQGNLKATDMVSVEIRLEGMSDWITIDTQTGLQSQWTLRTVNLTALAGNVIHLRFRVTTTGALDPNELGIFYYVDELAIAEIPPTATPTSDVTLSAPPTLTPSATAPEATSEVTQEVLPSETPTATSTETAAPSETPSLTPTATEPTPEATQSVDISSQLVSADMSFVPAPAYAPLASGGTLHARTINYTYDNLYRLTNGKYCDGLLTQAQCNTATAIRSYTYTYDLMGNRKSQAAFDGTSTVTTNYTYNLANQLISNGSQSFLYNPNGNLTSDGLNTYAYDGANRLTSYNSGAITYNYNGYGDRYRQTVNGPPTNYLLDLNVGLTQVVGEFKPGDTTYYLLGLDVIGQQKNGTWSYMGYDGLGSVRQLTDPLGEVSYTASYDPYGQLFETSGTLSTQLGFTGEYTNPNGLLYLRARYMSPSLGTFLSRDPVEGMINRSISRNLYIYASANPVMYVDPSGREAITIVFVGGMLVVLAGGTVLAASNPALQRDLQNLSASLSAKINHVFNPQAALTTTDMLFKLAVWFVFGVPDELRGGRIIDFPVTSVARFTPGRIETPCPTQPSQFGHLPQEQFNPGAISTPTPNGPFTNDPPPNFNNHPGSGVMMSEARQQAFNDLLQEAEELGVNIDSSADAVAYLDWASKVQGTKVNASTLGDNDIFIRPEYANNVRVLREEMIHIQQNRAGLVSTSNTVELEIQARELMIANRDAWGITDAEVQQMQAQIEHMRRTGGY